MAFRVLTPCTAEEARRFGSSDHLHLRGFTSNPNKKSREAGGKLEFLFDREDGGNTFLRSLRFTPNYTASEPRRPYTSYSQLRSTQIPCHAVRTSRRTAHVQI